MTEIVLTGSALLIAHLLTDFVFQTGGIIENKVEYGWKSGMLLIHVFVAGLLAVLLSMKWEHGLAIFLITAGSHWIIDVIKLRYGAGSFSAFVLDQLAHISVVIFLIFYLYPPLLSNIMSNNSALVRMVPYAVGLLLVFRPVSFLISQFVEQRMHDLWYSNEPIMKSGPWVGYMERLLIFIFILLNQYVVIGLLITSKFIIRYNNIKSRQIVAEYVLLGTLMSFTSAVLITFFIKYLLTLIV